MNRAFKAVQKSDLSLFVKHVSGLLKIISGVLRKMILSQLQCGFSFSQVVQTFKSACSKSIVVSILLESKVNKPIRKKVRPGRKIDRSKEKRLIRSLNIVKRPATIRAPVVKEKLGATTVQMMLNRMAMRTFKKGMRFFITKQNGARPKIC
jgi:hypothetical protein